MEGQPKPTYQERKPESLKQRFLKWTRYIRPQRTRNAEVQIMQPTPLKQYLLEAAKNSNLAVENLPRSIDLGEFGRESERLIRLSLSDPTHPEFASVGFVDNKGRVLLLREPIRGDESSVEPPEYEEKRRVFLMHSHSDIDTPFSGQDLEFLLVSPEHPRAVVGELLVTPSTKLLLFRTQQTKTFTDPNMVFDNAVDFYSHPAMAEEHDLMQRSYEAAGGDNLDLYSDIPLTSEGKQEMQQLSNRRMFALSRFAQKFNLSMYTCSLDKNIVYPAH